MAVVNKYTGSGLRIETGAEKTTIVDIIFRHNSASSLKKNLNAPRPSEHPPVRGKNVKTFRWDHRLQRQNLFMAFKRVP